MSSAVLLVIQCSGSVLRKYSSSQSFHLLVFSKRYSRSNRWFSSPSVTYLIHNFTSRDLQRKFCTFSYLTHLIFGVKTILFSLHLQENYLLRRWLLVGYLLRLSMTVKSVVLFWCKSYHEARRFPPINDSKLSFCLWDLICWKANKRLWNINWHRGNWLAKINTKTHTLGCVSKNRTQTQLQTQAPLAFALSIAFAFSEF